MVLVMVMKIGELSRLTGVKPGTIRFYEKMWLSGTGRASSKPIPGVLCKTCLSNKDMQAGVWRLRE